MSNCPLKEAARDTPNLLALKSKTVSFTFAEFDEYVDQIHDERIIVSEPTSPYLIALLLSAWRKNRAICPVNPKVPLLRAIEKAPPQSLLLFTSGSTGNPKVAVLSLANLIASAEHAIGPLGLKPGDQWLLSLPLYHVGGIGIVIRCILARAAIILGDSPDITHLSYVPTHLYRATPIYKYLRCLLLGGAPIASIPKHLPIYTTYGLTEMSSLVTLNGKVLPGREVKLAPDGEIFVRGSCLFQGYLGEPAPQAWFPTGDLGRIDSEKLTIIGRKDWMFISGGENIQPEEIERELLAIPEVQEAVVLPIDDAEFGKRPVALVKASEHFDLNKMQAALKDKLPKFKIPISLHFMDEITPRNHLKPNRFILSQYIKDQLDKNKSGQKKGA